MKKIRLIRELSDALFWASAIGVVFSLVMAWVTEHPIRSLAETIICMSMTLVLANINVWAQRKMLP